MSFHGNYRKHAVHQVNYMTIFPSPIFFRNVKTIALVTVTRAITQANINHRGIIIPDNKRMYSETNKM